MQEIDLQEYVPSHPVRLSVEERDVLGRSELGVAIAPVPGTASEYRLTPGSIVGAVDIDALSVRIAPKVGIRQLLSLACYAVGSVEIQEHDFHFAERAALADVLAVAFCAAARRAMARGVLHGYRVEEDALTAVRGRVRFDEQLQRRFGNSLPVEVRYG